MAHRSTFSRCNFQARGLASMSQFTISIIRRCFCILVMPCNVLSSKILKGCFDSELKWHKMAKDGENRLIRIFDDMSSDT